MATFFGDLFSGMSLDSLLVYACAIRGVFAVSSSKSDGPGLLATLLTRNKGTSNLKK